jgi:hypothetical protein
MATVRLEELAVLHSGDKGDICNIGVVPYSPEIATWLRDNLGVEEMRAAFGPLVKGSITRYELPGTGCLNFVMEQALGGGATRTLNLDLHGKSWSYLAATIELDVPDALLTKRAQPN